MGAASTILRDGAGRPSKATQGATAPSIIIHDEHQKGGAVSGHASRRLPHARFQFAGLGYARQRPAFCSLLHRSAGHPIHTVKLTLGLVQSRAGQPRSQFVAALVIHANRLSSLALVGIDPNEIGLTHEAKPLPPDGKIYD